MCWVFVDARELGKSRVRTNHSVAGIHYYRREYVPKSTLRSPLFLSSSLPFTSESSGTFFFFFSLSKLEKLWHILWSLHHRSRAEQSDKDISGMESYSGEDLFPYVALAQRKRLTQTVAIPDRSQFRLSHRLCYGWATGKAWKVSISEFCWTFLIALDEIPPCCYQTGKWLPFDHARLRTKTLPAEIDSISDVPAAPHPVPNEAWQSKSQDKRNVSPIWK